MLGAHEEAGPGWWNNLLDVNLHPNHLQSCLSQTGCADNGSWFMHGAGVGCRLTVIHVVADHDAVGCKLCYIG